MRMSLVQKPLRRAIGFILVYAAAKSVSRAFKGTHSINIDNYKVCQDNKRSARRVLDASS